MIGSFRQVRELVSQRSRDVLLAARIPVVTVVDVLTRRWTIPIVVALSSGPERFGALQRRVSGIAHKVLTDHLRLLERAGVVERTARGPRTQSFYQLSPKGLSLLPVIASIQSLQHTWEVRNESDTEPPRAIRRNSDR
jgi:DNA-binding HxlR family transcriptional regulator